MPSTDSGRGRESSKINGVLVLEGNTPAHARGYLQLTPLPWPLLCITEDGQEKGQGMGEARKSAP